MIAVLGVLLEFCVREMRCIPGGGLGGWGMQRDVDVVLVSTLKTSNRSPVTSQK
jgi:hypothetical protein